MKKNIGWKSYYSYRLIKDQKKQDMKKTLVEQAITPIDWSRTKINKQDMKKTLVLFLERQVNKNL